MDNSKYVLYIDIKDLYGWGVGITHENNEKWKKAVSEVCKDLEIEVLEPFMGRVPQGRKGELEIYFHPMDTTIKGNNKLEIKALAQKISNSLERNEIVSSVRGEIFER